MSKVLEKISQHYQSAIAGDLIEIPVAEWEMTIYAKKTYPFKDEAKIIEMQSLGKTVEALVESVVVKALDKDGKRIFRDADRITLMHEADPAVIVKVAGAINNAAMRASVETATKE